MTINEVQDSIIEEFSVCDDWMDKYNLLIDMGRELPVIDPDHKTNEYLIEGCQSKVWLFPSFTGGKVSFLDRNRYQCRYPYGKERKCADHAWRLFNLSGPACRYDQG